ncbi:hypothetical protein QBC38DRAFT_141800 [Podospora fimiseda]|uniref:Uncharacterized protein n=1 Tax=Podospora fimiseda TaxID=252190 RepID=A0AAN7BET7_9PEZI|nr:hypothetical protein QBC38DRAFT_141800 [Podospora fimiseda]
MTRQIISSLILFLPSVLGAATTNGPLAYVSLDADIAYKTARACAAGCLIYNGGIPCNAGSFKWDIGVFLGCGRCGQINGCYCSSALGSSATSYISSCVSSKCIGVDSWEDEVTSMLNMYNGYCATANVAPTTTTRPPYTGATIPPQATTPAAGSGPKTSLPTETDVSGAAATPPPSSEKSTEEESKDGLSKSDIVALAASLGVGIPSLAIAGITLWIQLRKKKNKGVEVSSAASGQASPEVQHAHLAGNGYGGRPHVQELGESRGYGRY